MQRIRIALTLLGASLPATMWAQSTSAANSDRAESLLNPQLRLVGRYASQPNGSVVLGYPGTGFIAAFEGTGLHLQLKSNSPNSALTVVVDHGSPGLILLAQGDQVVELAANLAPAGTSSMYRNAPRPGRV